MNDDAASRDDERLRSIGAFIWAARERVLAAATRRAAGTGQDIIECRLRGASMGKTIPAGSRIRIALVKQRFRVGDVVAFMDGDRVVVHRIVHASRQRDAQSGAMFITRGDAMIVPDAPIGAGAVLGHVTALADAAEWRPLGGQHRLPRRERLLGRLLLTAISLALWANAGFARRLARWAQASDSSYAWTRSLLY